MNIVPIKQPTGQRGLKGSNALLETVLASFSELLPLYPATFRPFASQIRPLLLRLLSGASRSPTQDGDGNSLTPVSAGVHEHALKLLIRLHYCAPRNSSGEEWLTTLRATIVASHEAADQVFRAVIEDWESSDPSQRRPPSRKDLSDVPRFDLPDALGLLPWAGLHHGAHRIRTLLDLLRAFLSASTSASITMPLGSIFDLMVRLCSLTLPCTKKGSIDGVRLNGEIGRDEREELWLELPIIHVAALDIMASTIDVFQDASSAVAQSSLDQLLWVFQAEHHVAPIRRASYSLIRRILCLAGQSLSTRHIKSLVPLFRSCCSDLLVTAEEHPLSVVIGNNAASKPPPNGSFSMNADSFSVLPGPQATIALPEKTELRTAAADLLPLLLACVPSERLPRSMRAQVDRTAILIGHRDAMTSSVLNPPAVTKDRSIDSSSMPFLAQAFGDDGYVDGILKPRLPILCLASTTTTPNQRVIAESGNGDDSIEEESEAVDDTIGFAADIFDELENSLENSLEKTSPRNVGHHDPSLASATVHASEVLSTTPGNNRVVSKRVRSPHGLAEDTESSVPDNLLKKARIGGVDDEDVAMENTHLSGMIIPTSLAVPISTSPLRGRSAVPAPATSVTTDGAVAEARTDADNDSDDSGGIPTLDVEADTDEDQEEDEDESEGEDG